MSKENDPGVVYGVVHTDKPDKVRYVGLTVNLPKRVIAHWASSNKPRTAFQKFLSKYRPQRNKIQFITLERSTRNLLPMLEEKWIRELRAEGQADLNLTDGGDGRKGYTPTPETVERFRDFLKTRTGEKSHNRKLNWDIVREIRRRGVAGWESSTKLAQEYGLVPASIRNILLNKNWVDESYDPSTLAEKPKESEKTHVVTDWETVNEIRELRKREYRSLPELSRQYGISVAAMHKIVENTSWVDGSYDPEGIKPDPRMLTQKEVEQVVDLRSQGLTFKEIALRMGRNALQVNRAYRKAVAE